MRIRSIKTTVFGQKCHLELMKFGKADSRRWKKLFDTWVKLKMGMREYKSREPNLPEGLSEVAFCMWSGSLRFVSARGLKHSSFDTYNIKTKRAEQIKASSIEMDLSSFGPKSKWDDLYFLDFYRDNIDGSFDVYLIPNELLATVKVNKNQLFSDQQTEKRRPRFSIKKDIILANKIRPLATDVRVWLS